MKFTLRRDGETRAWPGYILGGRIRTSTAGMLLAFFALFWVNQSYQPTLPAATDQNQVVPPGFVPDPNYTWVPRTNVRREPEYPTTTTTTTPTTTTTTTTEPTTSPEETTSTSPDVPAPLGPTTTVLDPDGPGPLSPQTFTQAPPTASPNSPSPATTPAPGSTPTTVATR